MKQLKQVLLSVLLVAFAGSTFSAQHEKNIVELASNNADLSTLVTAVQEAGLVDTLSQQGPFTVFAPTNEAFEKLPEGTLQKLLDNKDALVKVLTYHVVSGAVLSSEIKDGEVKTVEGADVKLDKSRRGVKVNDADVVEADIIASNGVVHVINTVLIPEDVKI